MDFHDYLRLFRRAWLQIAAVTLVSLGLSAVYLFTVPTTYDSSTALFVSANGPLTIEDLQGGTEFSAKAVTSYADIVSSATVLTPVSDELKMSVEDLQKQVSATAPEDTRLINIVVVNTDPNRAALVSNAVAQSAVRILPTLEGTPDGRPLVSVSQLRPAVAQPDSASPGAGRVLGIGLVVGLCVALGVALVRQALDSRIRSVEDLRRLADVPTLAVLPAARRRSRALIVRDEPTGPVGEAYRTLRTNLRFLESMSRRSLLFAAVGEDGRDGAVIPANLAWSLAQAGRRVLLVDLDLRGHAVSEVFELELGAGLTDILTDGVELRSLLHRTEHQNVHVLQSGESNGTPSDMLSSPRMVELLRHMECEYDYVILHVPPIQLSSDAAVIAGIAGATFLTLGMGRSSAPDLLEALETLGNVQVYPSGMVLVEQRSSVPTR